MADYNIQPFDDETKKLAQPSYLSLPEFAGTPPQAKPPADLSGTGFKTPAAPRAPVQPMAGTPTPGGQSALSRFAGGTGDPSSPTFAAGGGQAGVQSSAATFDATARNIYRTLQEQGHQVKWQGDQLIVDGRPYTIAGAPGQQIDQGGVGRTTDGSKPTYDLPPGLPDAIKNLNLESGQKIPGTNLTVPQGFVIRGGHTFNAQGVEIPPAQVSAWLQKNGVGTPAPAPGGGGGGGGGGGQSQLNKLFGFPDYAPGNIPTDTPSYTFDQILNTGPMGDQLNALFSKVLTDAEPYDQKTIDMMKASSKDEIAGNAAAEDEMLKGFGSRFGQEASPWLQSERLAGMRGRNTDLALSNRQVEMGAREKNVAARLEAAKAGASYQDQIVRQRALAADTQLRAAAVATDRLSLREAVAQKSAELKISKADVMADFIIGQLQVEAQRYGIDVNAQVDREQLKQQGQQFMEDLAFRYASLKQQASQFNKSLREQGRQFDLGFGLDLDKFEHDINNPPA